MKFEKKIVAIVVSMFLCFVVSTHVVQAQGGGLGISPSRLTIDHMLRDSEYKKTFVLSHGEHSEAKYLRVLVDDSIKDWITTDKGLEFAWPASSGGGEMQFPVTIIVKTPSDAPNGDYSGTIRIINTASPDDVSGGTGASVSLAVAIKANFTLTDEQVLDYEVHTISTAAEVEQDSPFEIVVHIENKGNVKARPSKVEVDFYDKFNKTQIGSQETEDFGSVGAFEADGEIIVDIPHGLELGQYWARILVFKDDEVVKEEDIAFEVLPTGSLAKQGALRQLNHESTIDPGNILKITGDFKNTGERSLVAKFIVEVYKGNSLVEVLEGDGRSVGVGQSEELAVFFTPQEDGEYRLEGRVEYSGKVTPTVKSTVMVGATAAAAAAGFMSLKVLLIGLVILIVIVAIGIFLKLKGIFPKAKTDVHNPPDTPKDDEKDAK